MSTVISRRGLLSGLPAAWAGKNAGLMPFHWASSRPNAIPASAQIFDIRDFGARGDGRTLATRALQAAVEACHQARGGVVYVPAGTYLIGTVQLKSWVTLHLAAGATLLGSGDGRDYYPAREIPLGGVPGDATLRDGHVGLLYAVNAENITFEGPGTIDGQGGEFRRGPHGTPPPSGRGGDRRPFQLLLYRCRQVRVRDLTFIRGAYHCLRLVECRFAWFDNLHIFNRVNGNNDGFHFISCEYAHVNGCDVLSGDDACALFGSCRNITIANSSFSTRWSVFRFGGGTAENITVSNCILHEVYGCPIKIQCNPGARFENIAFANLILQNVTGPIHIGNGPSPRYRRGRPPLAPASAEVTDPGMVRNISFNHLNIRVVDPRHQPGLLPWHVGYRTGELHSCVALNAMGNSWLENISFDDVRISYPGGGTAAMAAIREVPEISGEYFMNGPLPAWAVYARNVRGLELANVRFELRATDLRPAFNFVNVDDCALANCTLAGPARSTAAMRFEAVRNCLLTAPRLLAPAAVFLEAAGDCRDIAIDGGDLGRAARPVQLGAGVVPAAVTVRQ